MGRASLCPADNNDDKAVKVEKIFKLLTAVVTVASRIIPLTCLSKVLIGPTP